MVQFAPYATVTCKVAIRLRLRYGCPMSALPQPSADPAAAAAELAQARDPAWIDAFVAALERQRGGRDLAHILAAWQLSKTALGRTFGVSRQAVDKWLADGVPTERVAQVADLAAATDLLVHHLKRERIPAVVRRAAADLDDRSLVDVLAAAGPRAVLEACRRMFDFADVHA